MLKSSKLYPVCFILLAAGLACTFGSQAPAGDAPVPSQNDQSPESAAGQDAAAGETTAPTVDDPPEAGSAAPQVLDLETLPFGAEIAPNYSEHFVMIWEGTGLDGNPLTQEWDFLTHWFTEPETGYTTRIRVTENQVLQTVSHTSVFGGQSYFYDEASGCFIFPASAEDSQPADVFGIDIQLTGTAVQAETGLQVNGQLADRYVLEKENLAPTQGFQPAEYSQASGDLFYVRSAGYITRLVLSGSSDGRDFDFDGSADFVYTLDIEPLVAGGTPAPPEGCRDGAIGGLDFPRSQDAYELITMPNGLFYKSRMPLDELLALYRQELPALGWSLVDENNFDAQATLIFEKGGRSLTVNLLVNGEEISVSLVEER